nr:uncharacterized protein LOC123772087 isoform X2 [Procambarus clarkii]
MAWFNERLMPATGSQVGDDMWWSEDGQMLSMDFNAIPRPGDRPTSSTNSNAITWPGDRPTSSTNSNAITWPSDRPTSSTNSNAITWPGDRPTSSTNSNAITWPSDKPTSSRNSNARTWPSDRQMSSTNFNAITWPGDRPTSSTNSSGVTGPSDRPTSSTNSSGVTRPSDRPTSSTNSSGVTWPGDRPITFTDSHSITRNDDIMMAIMDFEFDEETVRSMSNLGVFTDRSRPRRRRSCSFYYEFLDEQYARHGSTAQLEANFPDPRINPRKEKVSRKRSPVNNITKRQRGWSYEVPVEDNSVDNDPRVLDKLMKDSLRRPMPEVTHPLGRPDMPDIWKHFRWCRKILNNPFD